MRKTFILLKIRCKSNLLVLVPNPRFCFSSSFFYRPVQRVVHLLYCIRALFLSFVSWMVFREVYGEGSTDNMLLKVPHPPQRLHMSLMEMHLNMHIYKSSLSTKKSLITHLEKLDESSSQMLCASTYTCSAHQHFHSC